MVFSGIVFLYYFLPVTAALYFLVPDRMKNGVLLLASLIFYAWGEPEYVLVLGCSVLSGYVSGLFAGRYRGRRAGRIWCGLSVAVSLSFLFYFKYADFFIANFNAATGLFVPLLRVSLPVGISFYTFQMISYTADVYRGEPAQRKLWRLALYIAMFPQLVAGPVVRYSDFAGQLDGRVHSWGKAARGIRRFAVGLAKKVLLADQLWELCGTFRASGEKSVLFYWLYAVSSALYIYFDFSGYSDMAIGLCGVFGFQIPENFHYPFISGSITEFWRRWHISLGTWFRDYVYIPLGGSRAGRRRQLFNILAVWLMTGLWHGAAWNFIVWGLLFAALLAAEKLWLLERLEKSRLVSHIYVLFFVSVSFVIFQADGMGQALSDLGGLFGAGGVPPVSAEAAYCLRSYAAVLSIAAVGATPLPRRCAKSLRRKLTGEAAVQSEPSGRKSLWRQSEPPGRKSLWRQSEPSGRKSLWRQAGEAAVLLAEPAAIILLLFAATAYLAGGSFQPFLYFRF